AQDEQVLAVYDDLGASVLRVHDLVALGDVERDALALIVQLAGAGREHLALLRLLLRGVGEHDARRGRLLLLDCLHDQPIAQGLVARTCLACASTPSAACGSRIRAIANALPVASSRTRSAGARLRPNSASCSGVAAICPAERARPPSAIATRQRSRCTSNPIDLPITPEDNR